MIKLLLCFLYSFIQNMTFSSYFTQGLIRLLSTCASGSPLGCRTLLLLGISSILKDILSGSGVSANASISPALSRPADQVRIYLLTSQTLFCSIP